MFRGIDKKVDCRQLMPTTAQSTDYLYFILLHPSTGKFKTFKVHKQHDHSIWKIERQERKLFLDEIYPGLNNEITA